MKFAKKMKLVPVGGREEPEIHQLSVLDNEMSTILKNPKLSTSAKMKLYHQVLMKNIAIEARLKQKSIENDNEGELQNISASAFNETNTSKIKNFIENNVLRGPWMNFKMRSQPRINYFEKSDTSDNKEKKKNKRKNSLDLDPDYI